ncbi:hypothetical protein SBA7_1200009 [Candidatus Sulfotelmatobacter sp. SbA7]|nr:hypothetical protein SBA7_1200009 [Candidatus Sulfotelmatobacter sp. SbA7]
MTTKANLPLTNTSSVPIVLSEMEHEYEIEYKGRIVRCKTADAAARLLAVLEQEDVSKDTMTWTPNDFTEFTERIQLRQRKLLARLLEYGSTTWLSAEKLCDLLGIRGNQALAGVLSGVTKVALSLDIDPRRIYLQTTRFKEGKPYRLYRVASGFLRAATEHEWPSKKDLEALDE